MGARRTSASEDGTRSRVRPTRGCIVMAFKIIIVIVVISLLIF